MSRRTLELPTKKTERIFVNILQKQFRTGDKERPSSFRVGLSVNSFSL
jgi:hypothetical protein